jgi:hypothetical protein
MASFLLMLAPNGMGVATSPAYHNQVLWSMLEDDWSDLWVTTASRVH